MMTSRVLAIAFTAALAVLVSVAACDASNPNPTRTSAGPVALPGERSASTALAATPDEWAAPPTR